MYNSSSLFSVITAQWMSGVLIAVLVLVIAFTVGFLLQKSITNEDDDLYSPSDPVFTTSK